MYWTLRVTEREKEEAVLQTARR
jgi:hypothetical protein